MIFFKEKFRQLREARGLTLEAIAVALNVSQSIVSRWGLKGKGKPRSDKIPKLAKILKCEESDLVLYGPKEGMSEHEEHSHVHKIDGIHWTGSLEVCEGSAQWFIIPHRVWLQPVFPPEQEFWAVTDMDGNEIEDMVRLYTPTILSNISVIDHSVRFQMFTRLGECGEEDVAPKMRALAKDYLTEVHSVVKALLPATKEVKYV